MRAQPEKPGPGHERFNSTWTIIPLAWLFALGGCDVRQPLIPASSRAGLSTSDWPSPIVRLDTSLTPSDPLQAGQFGVRVALSGDLLVAAAPSTNLDGTYTVGGAYVFERDAVSGMWTELTKLVPQGASDQWSFNVAIDGDTVVLGTPYRNLGGLQEGALYIFSRDQGGVDQWGEVKRISGAALGSLAQFGASLVLRGDLLIVGAVDPPDIGYVQVFERNRGGADAWGLVTSVGYQDGGFGPEYFGVSLALDGDLLLVGATSADVSDYASNDGAAYLFERDPINRDAWNFVARFTQPEAVRCTGGMTIWDMAQQAPEVQQAWQDCVAADSSTANAGFGGNVTVSGDTAVVGGGGAAYVFRRDPSNASSWPQVEKLESDDSVGYGRLLLQGDRLYAGSSGAEVDSAPARGAVHVLDRNPSSGMFDRVETLIAADGLSGDYFGNAIAVEGTTRVIAAYGRAGGRGALYIQQAESEPPPVEPPGCQPLRPPTDTLNPASSVAHASGFTLSATRRALAAPLPVWIEEVAAPVEQLPVAAAISGGFFEIGAECQTLSPPGSSFMVALPVPLGADPARLAAAALMPASTLRDSNSTGRVWLPLTGRYDVARGLYSVRVAGLSHEGMTFVLYEDPSPVTPPREAARVSAPFWVSCFGLSAADCDPQQQSDVQDALLEALTVFRLQGFPLPYLLRVPVPAASGAIEAYPVYLTANTDPVCTSAEGVPSAGAFAPMTASLHVCVDPADAPLSRDALRSLIRHELFHAIQHAFPRILEDPNAAWVIEGTAQAAEAWDGTSMHRQPARDLRKVDSALGDEVTSAATAWVPYQAQDFWVHLFRSSGRAVALGELNSFFELGATTQSVADRLAGGPTFDSLALEYWAWVKNQAFERTDVDFDGVLTNPCALGAEAGLVDYRVYTQAADTEANDIFLGLDTGLQAKVVVFQIPNDLNNATFAIEGSADILYKVYQENDPNVSDCRGGVADGSRTFTHLAAGSNVVVLLANTSHALTASPLVKLTIRTP